MSREGKFIWKQDFMELHLVDYQSGSPEFVFYAFRHDDDTWQEVLRMTVSDFAFFASIVEVTWKEVLRNKLNIAEWDNGSVSEEVKSGESTED